MKVGPIFLLIAGITLIIFPDIIAYILGWFLVILWIGGLISGNIFSFMKKKGKTGENYVQVGEYKIFR